MSFFRHPLSALSGVCFAVCSLVLLLSGCSVGTYPSVKEIAVAGNWQVSSTSATALPSFSGALSGTNYAMTGTFHSDTANACITPSLPFSVTGSTSGTGVITLTGKELAGGTLILTGTLAADGRSLEHASYVVTGGSCAMAQPAVATAQAYAEVAGTYTGSFSDANGEVISLSATLTQTAPDANGNFMLTGTGTFSNNPCFTSPVEATSSVVTGNSFTFTYADASANSVTASGTLSSDGSALTVTQWVLSGPCGPDSGTGLLER